MVLNTEDFESFKPWVSGFIVREWCHQPSNWRCERSLDLYLKANGITGIAGIDTRRLTRILRERGVMGGAIVVADSINPADYTDRLSAFTIVDAVESVTCQKPILHPAKGEKCFSVALMDYGCKENIARSLTRRGCEVTQLPACTTTKELLAGGYDGVMLSNGPGDPAENTRIIADLKELMKSGLPTFGICLGHQLLALAAGGQNGQAQIWSSRCQPSCQGFSTGQNVYHKPESRLCSACGHRYIRYGRGDPCQSQ